MGDQRSPSKWWALGALLPLVPFALIGRLAPTHLLSRLYFSGDPCRWEVAAHGGFEAFVDSGLECEAFIRSDASAALFDPSGLDDVRGALVLDLAFAATFAVVGFLLLRAGHRHWAPRRRRGDRWLWRHMPKIAVAAGLLDLVETSGQLVWLDRRPPELVTWLIASIAWWKWAMYALALVGFFGLVLGPVTARGIRPVMNKLLGLVDRVFDDGVPIDATPPDRVTRPEPEERLGITASGGGIRSAAVMAGLFKGLARDGTLQRATWLHAVSGGGFTSGGWRASSVARDEVDLFSDRPPPDPRGSTSHPWMTSLRTRRRYLDNGTWSIVGGVIGVVVRTIIVLGSVVAAAVLVGWAVGWLTGSAAIHPGFSNRLDPTEFADLYTWRLVLPGLVPVAIAVGVFVWSRTSPDQRLRKQADGFSIALGSLGVLLLVLLVAIPIGIWVGRPLLDSGLDASTDTPGSGAESSARWVGLFSSAGLAAAVWRMLQAEVTRRWSRLGGVFLVVGLLALAGKVADDRANGEGFFSVWWVPVVAVAWLVFADVFPSHRLTLNGIYRKRLAETFLLGRGDTPPLDTIPYSQEPVWPYYAGADGPELVLCGTAQSTRLELGGLPALGFAFRPSGVSLYGNDHGFPTSRYPTGSSWQGFPRRWTVSRSMALAGAAFSSAMGRQSYGSTNALLAAVNLRLGMWVPNPRRHDWFDSDTPDRNGVPYPPPRVHLGYFVKELFNRYDARDDAFVYVTDGGHRDNLGVVEQLREHPDRMIILDASGDQRGGFGTMRQAIALADVELDVQIDLDWEPLLWPEHDVPQDCITTGTARFRDGSGHETAIVYAKAQVCDTTPASLRQFGATDPRFPDYSTGDQFLTEEQWDRLVEFGGHMADRIRTFIS
ncbi:hypothetical protein [Ilumatobacter coccineus]|uniref:PNPLA domain-containing protein n=1 Tax=Ilumatobacter coccineus (strain NBRC 103263 / KCTC 29153 / YM16-304) TaxID=1313172 RepID=A0A6C7EBE2_ILUCY|nr:hypothetical protein [Ilumatobacter coccineus]BAN03700.1 hypothetical protein YM304_33860 [Ilumatobacter coccineus YM16-304]